MNPFPEQLLRRVCCGGFFRCRQQNCVSPFDTNCSGYLVVQLRDEIAEALLANFQFFRVKFFVILNRCLSARGLTI
jgi:hypothetical protein